MARKRINHNDLLPWFREDHGQLPAAYLKSCEKFFRELGIKATSRKQQAASYKRQAATLWQYDFSINSLR